jgi:hypothetical protein
VRAPAEPVTLVLAFAAWCPYSQRQLAALNTLADGVTVRGVVFDSSEAEIAAVRRAAAFPVSPGGPDLRRALGIRAYPTLFVYGGERLVRVLTGYHAPEAVRAALGGEDLAAPPSRELPIGCQTRG